MDKEQPETKYRRTTIAVGSTLLAGSVFTGPAAPFVALAGVAFLAGTGLRHLLNSKARETYNSERGERIVTKRKNLESSSADSFYPESPETAIARKNPYIGKSVLEQIARNSMYSKVAKEAESIAEQYMGQMKEINPERVAKSGGVSITLEETKNKGLKRALFGKGERGYKLNVSLAENE